jgi:hypothetical protein
MNPVPHDKDNAVGRTRAKPNSTTTGSQIIWIIIFDSSSEVLKEVCGQLSRSDWFSHVGSVLTNKCHLNNLVVLLRVFYLTLRRGLWLDDMPCDLDSNLWPPHDSLRFDACAFVAVRFAKHKPRRSIQKIACCWWTIIFGSQWCSIRL